MKGLDSFFKISERGSNIPRELLAGFTCFLTMAYVVVVVPNMLGVANIDEGAALTATCLMSALATLIMGLVSNRPIMLAPGLGTLSLVVYTIVVGMGVDWRVAMAAVFVSGVFLLITVVTGLRDAILHAIPQELSLPISLGTGLFIALIALKGGGIVEASESSFIHLGSLSSAGCIVALVSVLLSFVFHIRKVKGGLIFAIIISTLIAFPLGVTSLPTEWNFGLNFSSMFGAFQTTSTGNLAIVDFFQSPQLILMAFVIFMTNFFDIFGVSYSVASEAGFLSPMGKVEGLKNILVADSIGSILGGLGSTSSITGYVESGAGAAAGGRTGLSCIVVAVMFAICAFLSPVFAIVPTQAITGPLLTVAFLIFSRIGAVNWEGAPELVIPSFLIVLLIPCTYSIANGIGVAFITYCVLMTLSGKISKVRPLMWLISACFVALFCVL